VRCFRTEGGRGGREGGREGVVRMSVVVRCGKKGDVDVRMTGLARCAP